MIKGNAEAREDDEKIKVARELAKQIKKLGGSHCVVISTPPKIP